MAGEANGTLRLPWALIITAVVVGMLGLGKWTLDLEQRKADKSEVAAAVSEIRADLKKLIEMHIARGER
ncbi:MAG: hypothetical protein ABFD96_21390 [Armatimonadia bacterium]